VHTVVEAGARRHAAQVLPMVARALWQAGSGIGDLTRIVVGDGPGSFTGLRIGWAAAKGLAHERGLPVVAVPALAGLAHQAARAAGLTDEPVAACFDALRGQLFAAVYRFGSAGTTVLLAPQLVTAEALAAGPVPARLAVGDGAERAAEGIRRWTGRDPFADWRDSARVVIACGLMALADDTAVARPLSPPALAEPVYGRPAEAQVRWEARHGRPLPHPPG
jgi:tRNA threonylcarbamoyladenosine biosynthesis protein TsaB